VLLRAGGVLLCVLALAVLATCNRPPPRLVLKQASFADLPGWAEDDPAAALPALAASCAKLAAAPVTVADLTIRPDDWRAACAPLKDLAGDAARAYFEQAFIPFQAFDNDEASGLFTGYYEAELHGARSPDARYTVPLYRRPADLVSVDLGLFREDWKGERLAGRLANGRLVPYPTRRDIEGGALRDQGLEIAWVDSAIDAFFLEIQGSGRVTLPDGGVLRLGYDGDNGRKYVAIGHVLAERGVPVDEITMPYLRRWIADHGADGTALMDENPSYVFFRELSGDGPIGAEGVALTPGRSAAVDHRFVPYGLPLWIDTSDETAPDGRLRRLFVAQDTGGAIRGPVRADLFFGYGPDAADHAGKMRGHGSAWLLVPRNAVSGR